MPELPEVQTVVDSLRPGLVGQWLAGVRLARQDVLRPSGFDLPGALAGRRAAAVSRRGKRIIIALDDRNRLFIHLGMSGRLTLESAGVPLAPHTHLVIDLLGSGVRSTRQLRFSDPRRFGGIWWLGTDQADAGLGPEPLTLRPEQLLNRLSGTSRAIKNALLDQRVVAGLGNIYVDESLFAAGIHPLRSARRLQAEEVGRLCRAIKLVLRRAIRHRGTTLRNYVDADGAPGFFQKSHHVYGRAAEPCHTCKTPIVRIVLGGRSTHFCPRCQPRSVPRRQSR
jgi:formamidopyrimidine-DNA glycosylase